MADQQMPDHQMRPFDDLLTRERISRRSALRRLAGFALAGGSLAPLVTACTPAAQTPTPTGTSTPSALPHALGSRLYTYRGQTDYVFTVAWSPDGKRIVSGGNDGTAQVWNAANGGDAYIYNGHTAAVSKERWSPDGKRSASASQAETCLRYN